ncbi:glycoside hydrolase family 18 protein [Mycena metata]|uniref:Glycoside hydrolase family 18 protein n=2 Tax=Mycena metata TaxID=1033252 RepID=A0AAD7MSG2_9AGAR|nr:glycoside hydrolase family 18 protein [Mycena metata]
MFKKPSVPFLLCGPLLVSAAQYCSLKPPLDGTSTPASGIQHSATGASDVIASAWYPGWLATSFPPSSISWDKYNVMTFAFATTTPDPSMIALDDISMGALPTFVSAAQDASVPALLSIGGWTGSQYYSSAVGSPANRTAFINAILALVSKYNLDGIDFDWEYPGSSAGLSCNVVNPDDSANFLSMLQELRTSGGENLTLTAAVGIAPFLGADSTPMTDVSQFAVVLDRIAIMAYDVWGSWSSTVGPNAPLNDTCAPLADQAGSAVSAVNAWTAAQFPANQITLGLASYGHSFSVAPSAAFTDSGSVALYPVYDKSAQPLGNTDQANDTSLDPCGQPTGVGGVFTFAGLISEGYLNSNGTAADGISYVYDSCSQTPFVYNRTNQVMISYDDATSFAAKGNFINSQNLLGFAVWDVTGDQNDILLDSIHAAMGIETACE